MKILFLQTQDSTFWSHRLPFAKAALESGYEVVVATHEVDHGDRIRAAGIRLVPLPWQRTGTNPFYELYLALRIVRLYAEEKPDIVHQVTMKPVLYGSFAAAVTGVRAVVNTFTGLGFVFISSGFKARLLRAMIGAALRPALALAGSRTIFQNKDDLALFLGAGYIAADRAELIRGSGVDVEAFAPTPQPEGTPLVVLPARMLRDKGVVEFVEAARALRRRGVKGRFALVGDADAENPTAVPAALLAEWKAEGAVEWWGHRTDMDEVYRQASVVCLPSYREGLPKALMEAAACGRALAASDVPGCREACVHEETGLLFPVRDAAGLAAALERLLGDAALRARLGEGARKLATEAFAQEKVVEKTLAVYRRLLEARMTVDRTPDPETLGRAFARVIASLGAAYAFTQFFVRVLGWSNKILWIAAFDLNREFSLPSIYSGAAILFCAALLALTASTEKRRGNPFVGWAGMSAVFAFLALDEVFAIHEKLNDPLRAALHTSGGVLRYAWVIPYLILAGVFAAVYLPFLLRLPARTRNRFVISGLVFVFGAVGCELVGNWIMEGAPNFSVRMGIEILVEETMEMSGMAMFACAIADYLKVSAASR